MKNAVRRKEFFIYEIIYLLQQTTKIEENTTSITHTFNNLTKLIVQTTLISPIFFIWVCKKDYFCSVHDFSFPEWQIMAFISDGWVSQKMFPGKYHAGTEPITGNPTPTKIHREPSSLSLSLYVCMCLKAFMRLINV